MDIPDTVPEPPPPVRQLRLVIAADDYAAALAFYRDTLGLPELEAYSGGAELVARPRETPWRSLNSRLNAPEGVQLTLFEELDPR
ncbi:hypothetical protein OL239_17065 [Arthrobacter sp. ATA002]|uniref:VOC family protein n=1 Tax=Arthrobacter sp. ATA002 TaxID=2991715 RepID=UPI0022A7D1D3|nr:VOC family protein [Arthrobacter sp. ATA002]WAP51494.1 hypothetical protein OL239_17065 [Arthrobacter sp. ATA002]